MSKKKNVPAREPAGEAQATGAQSLGALGGMLLLVGGLILVMDFMDGSSEQAGWLRYGGIGALIAGALCWYFSGMPKQQTLEWIKSGVFALSIALVIRWAFAEPYRIPSGSMETTLHGDPRMGRGDRVFVNKWVYGVRFPFMNKRIYYGEAPDRWDIVVFKAVEENADHPTLVKRIVGMPGEKVVIRGGKIYANGQPLELPEDMPEVYYTVPGWDAKYGIDERPEFSVVPEGHYLVLGDNSAHSRDGRFFGWLPNEHIVGRVSSIWWPPSRWRDFTGFSQTWWWKALLVMLGIFVLLRLFVGRSWAVYAPGGKGINHLFVLFAGLGFRLPFTPWWLARWGQPRRGDCILFTVKHEAVPRDAMLVGRVAGLPGEEVQLEKGRLLVNNTPVTEAGFGDAAYLDLPQETKRKKVTLAADQYFILADDPDDVNAIDSRRTGPIAGGNIQGQVKAVWWPPRRWERVR